MVSFKLKHLISGLIRRYRAKRQIDALKLELQALTLSYGIEDDIKAKLIFATLKRIRELESEV